MSELKKALKNLVDELDLWLVDAGGTPAGPKSLRAYSRVAVAQRQAIKALLRTEFKTCTGLVCPQCGN